MPEPIHLAKTAVDTENEPQNLAPAKPVTNSASFLEVVEQSRLVPRDAIGQLRSEVAADASIKPAALAERLVREGHLTIWQSQQLLAGKTQFFLGRYKFLDRLGVGGMGAVFKAKHEMMGRTVALKMIRRKLLEDEKTRSRFLREIKAVAALEHPNIVTAYDADEVGNMCFLVMEYVDGKDLGWWVQQHGPFSFKWACEFCRQAALGLQHASQRGLVHRDIKPTNLLAVRESPPKPPTIKILDFGLAQLQTDEVVIDGAAAGDSAIRRSGMTSVVGTFGFMAPEQIRRLELDVRADIFALGCTLFYLLTGQLPFTGKNDAEYVQNLLNSEPRSARAIKSDVPAAVEAVLRKMLARDPKDRYQTPQEVADALWPFSASTMKDFATARVPVPLPASIVSKLPTPAKVEAGVDTMLGEFGNGLTNRPTDITGLELDDLLSARELSAAKPLPGAQLHVDRRYEPGDETLHINWRMIITAAAVLFGVLVLVLLISAAMSRFRSSKPSRATDERIGVAVVQVHEDDNTSPCFNCSSSRTRRTVADVTSRAF